MLSLSPIFVEVIWKYKVQSAEKDDTFSKFVRYLFSSNGGMASYGNRQEDYGQGFGSSDLALG